MFPASRPGRPCACDVAVETATLRASEARHRAMVEDQAELVSLADARGTLVYVNPAYAQHFRREPAALVGVGLLELVDPDDVAAVRACIAEVFASGVEQRSENRMLAADGSERWVGWTNRLHRNAAGEALLHSVGRDITEQRRVERALRHSQAFLARTGRVAGVGGWQLELATGALEWTAETRRIHEVDAAFVPTLDSAVAFYSPEARDSIEHAVREATVSGRPWHLELPLVTAGGRRIWVRAQGEAEYEAGRPVRLVGAFQDITETKLLEERLAESERFVRRITDGVPVRVAYCDREARFRFVNEAHCERFGLGRDEILGRTRAELLGEADAEFGSRIAAVLAGQAQRFEHEESFRGRVRRIESQLVADVDAAGAVRGFYSTGVDVTERTAAEKSLRMLTDIVEHTPDFVVQADRHGQVSYMNAAARRACGLAADEPLGLRSFADFNTAETNELYERSIVPAVKASGIWVGETTVHGAGRRVVPVSHMVLAHRDARGRIERYSAVMRDISAQAEANKQVQRQTATMRAVIEAMPAIVAVVGADERYRLINSAYERWFGISRANTIGSSLLQVLGRADYARSRPWVARALAGEAVEFEKDYPQGGAVRHLRFSYIPLWVEGAIDGFVGTAHDVTGHKREELRLLQLARHDPLTDLLNRAGVEAFLEGELQRGRGAALAVLYIDLDRFKPVNDQHGHPVGDALLRAFGDRIRRLVRPSDAVARLGGDEFLVVLVGVETIDAALGVADKVIQAGAAPFAIDGLAIGIGVSVGVAHDAGEAEGWPGLVARADAMLYRAKAAGRGRHASEPPDPSRTD